MESGHKESLASYFLKQQPKMKELREKYPVDDAFNKAAQSGAVHHKRDNFVKMLNDEIHMKRKMLKEHYSGKRVLSDSYIATVEKELQDTIQEKERYIIERKKMLQRIASRPEYRGVSFHSFNMSDRKHLD